MSITCGKANYVPTLCTARIMVTVRTHLHTSSLHSVCLQLGSTSSQWTSDKLQAKLKGAAGPSAPSAFFCFLTPQCTMNVIAKRVRWVRWVEETPCPSFSFCLLFSSYLSRHSLSTSKHRPGSASLSAESSNLVPCRSSQLVVES